MTAASEEDFLSGLHQLIKNIEPAIKSSSGSIEIAEDAILHLEETDENFHKYALIKYIREYIENQMGSVVDDEIEKSSFPSKVLQQEALIKAVTKRAVDSSLFSSVTQDLCAATTAAIKILLQSVDEEHHSASSDEDTESQLSKKMLSVFSEGDSSFGSSYNQGMFFMSQEQFHKIAQEMDVRQPLNVRREALSHLCQVPPSDVMASESWSELRVSLMDALADSDNYISHTALSFHAKMFAVSNYQITKETYTCLAEHLWRWFKSPAHLPLLTDTLDITDPFVEQILKRIRLVNEFQREVPLIWVRYPESFLEVIVDSTLNLLTVHLRNSSPNQSNCVSALHFLSLVDIKAHWFRRWLHGNYSRAAIIKKIDENYRSLLIEAVMQCLTYCSESLKHKKSPSKHANNDKTERRMTYTPKELRYVYFCHCLSLVTRLLLYSGGRSLFPLQVNTFTQPITVQHVLIACIKLLALAKYKPRAGHKAYESAALVGKAVCTLCSSNAFVESSVDAAVLNSLLVPIKTWLDGNSVRASEPAMLHIAEILSSLTSTCSGRKLLMRTNASDRKLSVAHVIADFAQKMLSGELPHNEHVNSSNPPSFPVICAFVFVCRQMYNTCEGLLLLLDYQLHNGIAVAWRQAHDRRNDSHGGVLRLEGDRETEVDAQSLPTQASSQNIQVWEENLLDNLLNFAATPKGLLLLQQTGAIAECVTYMHSRYTKKLQVSKCEKFGYGVMVTQVAATAAGIKALSDAGYIRAIIGEAWINLECATDEIRMTAPRPHPLNPIDRSVHKTFMGLVNLLSSYKAVHEIFTGEVLPNRPTYTFREIPQSAVDLIDRLVMINSDSKVHSLFNYEQSLVFGLRLLTVLSCNLDSWLLLETQYNIQQLLLELQKNNRTPEGEIIIDQLSVERNHLLVRTLTLGGSKERHLPERTLRSDGKSTSRDRNPYVWPLFHQLPLPKEYCPTLPVQSSMKKDSPLTRFLAKTKSVERDRLWLDQLRVTFVQVMTSQSDTLRGGIIADVLEKAVGALGRLPDEKLFKKKSSLSEMLLYSLDICDMSLVKDAFAAKSSKENPNTINAAVVSAGVAMTVRYGKHVNALKSNSDTAASNLKAVIKSSSQQLAQQQVYSSALKLTLKPYPCHDWFASTIFLVMSGNKDRSISFLTKISELLVSGYVWPARLHASIHLSDQMRLSGIPPLYCCSGHHIELILQAELPSVYSAFRMSGYTPSQICQHWLSQCFWNYLTWTQITHYVSVVVVMGADYQVYFCVSILKHLQEEIQIHRQYQDLQVFLKENALEGFASSDWISYMTNLERKYRTIVLASMRNILQSSS